MNLYALPYIVVIVVQMRRHFVDQKTPQSAFTGAQQRGGDAITPFASKGVFGVGRRRPLRKPTPTAAAARKRARSSKTASPRLAAKPPTAAASARQEPKPKQANGALFGCGDEDEDMELPRNYTFYWGV